MHNSHPKNKIIEISMATIVKSVLFVLFLWGLYYIRNIVAVVLFSIVVASALEPAANWFEKRKIPRALSIVFIYIVAFLLLGSTFYLIVPNFMAEITNFALELPRFLENPVYLQKLLAFAHIPEGSFANVSQEILLQLRDQISAFTVGFFTTATAVFGSALSFGLVIVLSFYFSVQKKGLENFLRIVTPLDCEEYILGLWKRSRRKIGRWMQGQILLGILVGVLVFLGLTILRVPYALSFALLAAVFELIPIFGPILACIPPIAIAFLQSPAMGLAVLILFIIIQQFENHLIYPLVVRKIVGIPPILVILSILIGGTIGGFFGILLAIPTATVLMEFLNDVSEKKNSLVCEKK